MGDPKRQRKKYSTPVHPWLADRIAAEKVLHKDYGLKNQKEIWKAASLVKNFAAQAKRIIAEKTEQAKKEETQLLNRLQKLGFEMKNMEDVLGLKTTDILEKRLQTIVFKRGLARTMRQARQFIRHGHILVGGKKITVPGFLVPKSLEPSIGFAVSSSLFKEDHPERVKKETAAEPKKEKPKEKKQTKKNETKKPKSR